MSNLKVNTIEAAAGSSIVANSYIKCNLPAAASNDLVNKQYVDSSIASIPTTSTFYVDQQNQVYASQADAKYVDKASGVSETILGTKTFNNTPKFGTGVVTTFAEDITNKSYVDTQDASILSQSNAYTDGQISSVLISSTPFLKISVFQAATGSSAFYTDPVAPFLTGRDPYFLYANDSNYFTVEGRNGLSVTGSSDDETFNIVSGNGVTSVTQTVNRVIIDANSLGSSNQTWQNVLASRSSGQNYVNTTGRPIQVIVKPDGIGSVQIAVGATSSAMTTIYNNSNSIEPPSFVVPISAVYRVTATISSPNGSWMELR